MECGADGVEHLGNVHTCAVAGDLGNKAEVAVDAGRGDEMTNLAGRVGGVAREEDDGAGEGACDGEDGVVLGVGAGWEEARDLVNDGVSPWC